MTSQQPSVPRRRGALAEQLGDHVVERVTEQLAGRLGVVQRRVRRLVPAPVRRADLAAFRAVARADLPVLDRALPSLSRAANHSRLWLVTAGVLAATGGRFGRRGALRGLVAVGITSAVTNLPAKLLAGRDRPDLSVVPQIRRLARVPSSTSFPSGHAASAFAFATAVGIEDRPVRLPLLGLATGIALSRVTTGVHYPGDVVVGAAIGAAVAHGTTRWWPRADDEPTDAARPDGPSPRPGPDGEGLVVVVNAQAGGALDPGPTAALRDAFPAAEIVEVEEPRDLASSVREASDRATVVAVAGGDGTASTAAAVLAGTSTPLVVVPSGTLDHLATDLGLRRPADAVAALREGRTLLADLSEVDGRTFVNAASIGVYPHLVRRRERTERWLGKWPSALLAAVRVLATSAPWDLEVDGRHRRVWLLFVGNGRFTADGLAPTRRARLDTGVLDVRLVDADVTWARTRLLWSALTGRYGRCAAYERWHAERLHVRSRAGDLHLAADGETWEGPGEVTFPRRPGRLRLVLR